PCLPVSPYVSDTPTNSTYTLSLHDALPIFPCMPPTWQGLAMCLKPPQRQGANESFTPALWAALDSRRQETDRLFLPTRPHRFQRSEEHTSELQSPYDLVCRLLLEKKSTERK